MNKVVLLWAAIFAFMQFTSARVTRDLSLGYNYNSGHNSDGAGSLQALGSTSYSADASGNSYFSATPSFGTAGTSGFVPSTDTVFLGGGGNGHGALYTSAGVGGSSSSQNYYNEQSLYSQAPIITKHFYIHTAPEDHDEQQIVRHINIGRPQKNYRVVFINAPSSTVSKAKIIAKVPPVEDRTAIYVLAKKSNALDISAEVVTHRPVHTKPEVFFVKYKTAAEAEHAQQAIQAKYDGLGGSSHISNEGVIPVSSVIGSLGGGDSSANIGSIGSSSGFEGGNYGETGAVSESIGQAVVTTGDNTNETYLPANHK